MSTALDRLIESIDPRHTFDRAAAQADQAFNSFPMTKVVITDWEEFTRYIVRFVRHLDNILLGRPSPDNLEPNLEWGRCCMFVSGAYGREGPKVAFEITRTGNEGGLYAVMNAVARQMAEEYAGNEIGARVSRFFCPLGVEERFAVIEEYLEKYGHLLPPELTEKGGIRIKAGFPKVLCHHPGLVQRLRRVGR